MATVLNSKIQVLKFQKRFKLTNLKLKILNVLQQNFTIISRIQEFAMSVSGFNPSAIKQEDYETLDSEHELRKYEEEHRQDSQEEK